MVPALGDIRNIGFVERVFAEHHPDIIIHAAAHKHVHQLEFNVPEGISNNVLGTYRLAEAAEKHGAEVFLFISTDKAVRPASILGVTKRAAEPHPLRLGALRQCAGQHGVGAAAV